MGLSLIHSSPSSRARALGIARGRASAATTGLPEHPSHRTGVLDFIAFTPR